jgi:hemerythrin-like domain-containing protein
MGIQIGQKPSPTFQQPLELLSDCHRRIEKFLRALVLVTEQAKGGALDERQREALQTALRYFREAAPKHTADEEESLFPRMRTLDPSGAQEALEKIQHLEKDHVTANRGHELVEQIGKKWLRDNKLSDADAELLLTTLRILQEIYVRHIEVEDKEIFPFAAKVLDDQQLADVGREMAERRGQDFIPSWSRQKFSKS